MTDSTHRFRATAALFAGVGLSATGFITLITVTPLVAEDLLGSARWSGLPTALAIMGTAAGTSWLSFVMSRRGRRNADAYELRLRAFIKDRKYSNTHAAGRARDLLGQLTARNKKSRR